MSKIALIRALFTACLGCLIWAALPARAADWPDEIREAGLIVRADFALQNCRPVLEELRAIRDDLQRELQLPPATETIHLFLFDRAETYQRYLDQHLPGLPRRTALYVKARGPGMVFAHRGADFERDLRHETTHAILHASLPVVPLWLDEGLAEYFEAPADRRVSGNEHGTLTRWSARQGFTPDLSRLEQMRDAGKMTAADYRESWGWTHFLLNGPADGKRELRAYIGQLGRGEPGELTPRIRRAIPNWAAGFREHFMRQEIALRDE